MLEIGTEAPSFTLPDQNGSSHSLSDYKGQWIVLYFYPKDDTPGCTKEACGMRDNLPRFANVNAVVFGISKDSPDSHKKFADKYDLPFTLLSDEDASMMQSYEVWREKINFGKKYFGTKRMSFIIDPKGTIAKIYNTVKPAEHAEKVLSDLTTLQS